MSQSSAIVGAVYSRARSFTIATTGTVSTEEPIAIGGYYLLATDADCWACVGKTGSTAVDGSAVTAQPATSAPNGLLYVPSGVPVPLDVSDDGQVITAITETGTGKLRVIGPIGQSARR
jgi:hypothetical protein